jgi:guanylate kinase
VTEIARRGLMFVLSSPSGAGKSTLARRLLALEEGQMVMSVSVTTRPPRKGEVDGVDYHFLDRPAFDEMVAENAFLEYAEVFGNCYGTPLVPVQNALEAGTDVLFDIDWQGTQQLAQKMPKDLVRVFILPPSTHELERRLRGRGLDSDEVVARRMAKAADEISHWAEYDYVIVNDDVDLALAKVRAILHAERLKRERQTGLMDFVRGFFAN